VAVGAPGRYSPAVLRAVFFDFNGVLLDDEPLHGELLRALASEDEIDVPFERYATRYVGMSDRTAVAAIWGDAGRPLPPDALRRLLAEKARRYAGAIAERAFFPGARELVREAARRVPIGAVSGALRAELVGGLKRAGVFDRFTALVASEDVTRGKPDPEGYLRGLELVNRDLARRREEPIGARHALAIEDTEHGVAAARAAGLKVIAVGHTLPRHRLEGADAFVPRLLDLELDVVVRELFG
jgi:HAD superfamily hydrolase (TIGR01509 family)